MLCAKCPKAEQVPRGAGMLRCPYEPGIPKWPSTGCDRHEATQTRELLRCPRCGAPRSRITLDRLRVIREHHHATEGGYALQFDDCPQWFDDVEDAWEYTCGECGEHWPLDLRSKAALMYRLWLQSQSKATQPAKAVKAFVDCLRESAGTLTIPPIANFCQGLQVKVVAEKYFGRTGVVETVDNGRGIVQVELYWRKGPRWFGPDDLVILPGLPGPGRTVKVLRDAYKHVERDWESAVGCTGRVMEVTRNTDLVLVELQCGPENGEPPRNVARWYKAEYLEVL